METNEKEYNLIPLDDHCAIAGILNELELRKCSYPFDWIARPGIIQNSNLPENVQILLELSEFLETSEPDNSHKYCIHIKTIVQKFVGDALTKPGRVSGIKWFPHEDGTPEEIMAKYERRFRRLYTAVKKEKNIFIIIIRHLVIPESYFQYMLARILHLNSQNKIVFVGGSDHPYLRESRYNGVVYFNYAPYDLAKLDRDFSQDKPFQSFAKQYMRELFCNLGREATPFGGNSLSNPHDVI